MTTINYELPKIIHVTIAVYDLLGREVMVLLDQKEEPGYKSVTWDATNKFGEPVSAGVYLYQIRASDYIETRKMVLLK